MLVTVEIPPKALFPLTDAAEAVGMTVSEYVARAGLAMAGLSSSLSDSIEQLHSLGLPDAEIARRLNMTNAAVAKHRRRLQLPPNRLIRGSRIERKPA